jgi:hypothetical protein
MYRMPFLPNLHGSKIRVFHDSFVGGCYDFWDRTWDLARSDISHVVSHSDISHVQSRAIRRLRRPISRDPTSQTSDFKSDTDPCQKDVGWMQDLVRFLRRLISNLTTSYILSISSWQGSVSYVKSDVWDVWSRKKIEKWEFLGYTVCRDSGLTPVARGSFRAWLFLCETWRMHMWDMTYSLC